MKQQAMNPFLPSYEYIPDGEPHIFEGRIYLYGSHDRFDGASFCLNDYVTYSCPVDDLSSWRYEGVIFQKKQDPKPGHSLLSSMFAPDVCKGADGRYYLYYFIGYRSEISVAVSSSPKGPFSYYGKVVYSDGTPLGKKGESLQFDPGVFVDEDGRIYLYTGFGPKHRSLFMLSHRPSDEVTGFELSSDMKTIKDSFSISVPSVRKSKGTSYEGHAFFEASSMRKFQGRYYFIYSSELGHELCYAMSSSPRGPFEYKGTLVSIGDIGLGNHSDPKSACNFTGNTHGSVLEVNGEYYVFYHRQTNRHQFSRQACAEKLFMREDGTFSQARVTSSGLNGKPLCGIGKYETRIACVLKKKGGNRFYSIFKGRKGKELYFTQTGKDREENGDQYLANISDGALFGFRSFDLENTKEFVLELFGKGKGVVTLSRDEEGKEVLSSVPFEINGKGEVVLPLHFHSPDADLYLSFRMKGHVSSRYFSLR